MDLVEGVEETFIEVKKKRLKSLTLFWYPIVLAKFEECRKSNRFTYLIDCYISDIIKSPIPRFLTIRRLRSTPKLSGSPTLEAPILPHRNCSIGSFMRDAYELSNLLQDEGKAVDELKKVTSQPISPVSPAGVGENSWSRHIYSFRTYLTGVRLLGEVLKILCLDEGKPPTSWVPSHVMLGVDVNRELAYFIIGSKEERMKTFEEFLFTPEVKKDIIEKIAP